MPQLRGSISTEELLEEYGSAAAMFLDNNTYTVGSGFGGTLEGGGTFTYSVTYDTAGFTGNGWYAPAIGNLLDYFDLAGAEAYIEENLLSVAQAVDVYPPTTSCASYQLVSS